MAAPGAKRIKVKRSAKLNRTHLELLQRVAILRAAGRTWEAISLELGEPIPRLRALHDQMLQENLPNNVAEMLATETRHLWALTEILMDDLKRSVDTGVARELRELSTARLRLYELAAGRSTDPGTNVNVNVVNAGTTMSFGRSAVPAAIEAGGDTDDYIEALKAAETAAQQGAA